MMYFLSKIILYIAFFVFTVIFSNNVFSFKKEIEEMSKKITASQNITYAYISKYSNSIVTSCVVKSDGSLSECKNTGNSINNPSGIDFDYFNNLYVTNNNYTIVFCPASYNGQLPLCANAGGGEFSIPNGIVFNKGYALIANAVCSSVSVCKQNENGMLCS
ncbi:hypothetical protein [Fluviispira sanaruensis]|uniref:Uncharacterized protein n=1 Tax=Fluviispira sanaruensis TaxID=2493639 RepID=A0A4P2VKW4_FLUSA|nr:hypothetical protein [Fluviispira sanaruensis]BBH53963.1 hypothetical protein JCM31447_24160 [Fluviispira sanaruensis]